MKTRPHTSSSTLLGRYALTPRVALMRLEVWMGALRVLPFTIVLSMQMRMMVVTTLNISTTLLQSKHYLPGERTRELVEGETY